MTAATASQNISIAYAITYIFGTIGLIVFIRYLPLLLRIDLPAEARKLADERGFSAKKKLTSDSGHVPIIRAYELPREMIGKTIEVLRVAHGKLAMPLRMRRQGKILKITDDMTVEEGDIISVISSLNEHERRGKHIGLDILDSELLNFDIITKEIVVIRQDAVDKKLSQLEITSEYGCYVRGIKRASIDLPVDNVITTNKGDRLYITGEAGRLNALAKKIGRIRS